MKFSEKIIKLRKENGLSQEEFGDKINVSRQAISKWESEQSQPEVEKVKEISKIFGVSIEYLLNDELENEKIKKVRKFNKKKLLNMLLKVVILILIVYLSYSIYKFIILFDRYNNIQKISDNEICGGTITSYYEDKLTKDKIRSNSNFLSGEEIYFEEIYYEISGNYAQQYNLNQRYITYINKENNFKFYLTYDTEKQKYIYDEEDADEVLQDIEFPYSTRKQLYIASLLDMFSEVSFIQMLKASLNPSIIVTDEYIKHLYIDGYSVVEFNNKGDIYEGISKSYIFTDKEEGTNVYEVDQRFDYNIGYYNEEGTLIEYDLKNIESIEDFARSYGIEVEIEK